MIIRSTAEEKIGFSLVSSNDTVTLTLTGDGAGTCEAILDLIGLRGNIESASCEYDSEARSCYYPERCNTGHGEEKDIMKKYVILAAVCWFAVISLVGIILTVYDKRIAGSGSGSYPRRHS